MNMKPLWERLTFSGLQRYVMVCECVFNSPAFLSQADKAQLIQDLLTLPEKHSPESVEKVCQDHAEESLQRNMRSARLNLEYERGY